MRESEAKRRKLDAAGQDRRRCRHRPGAGLVHDRAGVRHQAAAGAGRLERRGRRPLRGQRGVRGRDHGGHARSRRCRTRRSTCTAAPARWAIRSALRARASSSRCWRAMEKYGQSKGVAALCIGGGEATAVAIERVGVRTIHTEIGIGAPAGSGVGRAHGRPTSGPSGTRSPERAAGLRSASASDGDADAARARAP